MYPPYVGKIGQKVTSDSKGAQEAMAAVHCSTLIVFVPADSSRIGSTWTNATCSAEIPL